MITTIRYCKNCGKGRLTPTGCNMEWGEFVCDECALDRINRIRMARYYRDAERMPPPPRKAAKTRPYEAFAFNNVATKAQRDAVEVCVHLTGKAFRGNKKSRIDCQSYLNVTATTAKAKYKTYNGMVK